MHTLFVCDMGKFREVIDLETFYGVRSTYKFMNFTRSVPEEPTFGSIRRRICNSFSGQLQCEQCISCNNFNMYNPH
jgi:hypothetical protein